MKILLALFLSAISSLAATTNITFTWDAPMPTNTAFKFYELIGSTRTLLGVTTTNRFTVMNWPIGTPRIFTVTQTNMWGEAPDCIPFIAPPSPALSSNLAPVALKFITPVPGVLELSRDLADWRERLRITAATASSASIELVQIPMEPMLFGRVKPPTLLNRTALPIPITKPQ